MILTKIVWAGWGSLTERDLLSLVLGSAVQAELVLARFGSLGGLCNQPMERVVSIEGISEAKAFRLGACYEIAARFCREGVG